MHLLLLGVSHKTAPVELRERLDFSSRNVGEAVEALVAGTAAAESVVVSTCNRSEVYVVTEDPQQTQVEVIDFLARYHDVRRETFTPHLFSFDDGAAAGHLFRVAAGLDSMVVGEPQILGQVKDAYQAAAERQAPRTESRPARGWACALSTSRAASPPRRSPSARRRSRRGATGAGARSPALRTRR